MMSRRPVQVARATLPLPGDSYQNAGRWLTPLKGVQMPHIPDRRLSRAVPFLIMLALAAPASGASPDPAKTSKSAPAPSKSPPVGPHDARTVLITGANRGLGLEFS